MTEKKAIKAAKRLKKYCASFEECNEKCVFRDKEKYRNGCMLRESAPPEDYDEITEREGESGRAKE